MSEIITKRIKIDIEPNLSIELDTYIEKSEIYFSLNSTKNVTGITVNLTDPYGIIRLDIGDKLIKVVKKEYFCYLLILSDKYTREQKKKIQDIIYDDNFIKEKEDKPKDELEEKISEIVDKKLEKILKKLKINNTNINYFEKEDSNDIQPLYPITVIAKNYDLTAQALNTLLSILKVQYKVGDIWVLYEKYTGLGLVKYEDILIGKNKHVMRKKKQMLWTNKGAEFIDSLLRKHKLLVDKQINLFEE